MKVYLLIDVDYDSAIVQGAYSTRELAERAHAELMNARIAREPLFFGYQPDIREITMDVLGDW